MQGQSVGGAIRNGGVLPCLEFTLNPLLLHSRGVDEKGSQSLTHVILRLISQILVNVTLKLVDACGHNSTSRKSIPIVYYPLSESTFVYQA